MRDKPITWHNIRSYWSVIFLPLPTLLLVLLFSYYPACLAITHSFFRWDGSLVEEFIGLANFNRMLGMPVIWSPVILGSMLACFALLANRRNWRLVWLVLSALCGVISILLLSVDGIRFAGSLGWRDLLWWLVPLGVGFTAVFAGSGRSRTLGIGLLYGSVFAGCVHYLAGVRGAGDAMLWMSFQLIFILIAANFVKMWPSIFTAVCIHRLRSERAQYFYRVLFVIPMIIPTMVMLLVWKYFFDPNIGPLNEVLRFFHLDSILAWLDENFFRSGAFIEPFRPAWLAEPSLIVVSLIFWGFPWVGVVGVLIYLAGLQNIGTEIYEAAELEGAGWWQKFTYIEFPLILTQVRINLILMVIGTFQSFGLQLVLLGPEGGAGNRGLTPGLYMFFVGFTQQEYGYACAIGLLLFTIILLLTVINNKFVRIEK